METLQLSIEKRQLISLLQTMDISDKLEMYGVLKKSLMHDRLDDFLNAFENNELEAIAETMKTFDRTATTNQEKPP